ncbi:MAG: helix-turn-helix transcriptional regulator [Clostridia bacterium]
MLKETEWTTINNILVDIYSIDDIVKFTEKIMRIFKMLIPYTKGYFLMLDDNNKIDIEKQCFVDMDENLSQKYINAFYDEDYLKFLYDISAETTIYKDTDILDEEIRTQTKFYTKFLKPTDIPFGCGILIVKDKKVTAVFNLFRSEDFGDFSDKDIYILNVFKKHIENIVTNLLKTSKIDLLFKDRLETALEKYQLTQRESQILNLLSDGLSSEEIASQLIISLSTVKKHTYNLYNKTGVKNRAQLINQLYKSND